MLYPLSYGGSWRKKVSSGAQVTNSGRLTARGTYVDVSVALVPDRAPTVLVVDDSDVIRSLIVLNFELEGFDVHEASDGQECLDMVERVAPDLITLDVAMPRRDGFSTLEALRANPATASIPIVIVSARAQGADLTRGAELGVDAYVTKPFEPSELIEAVRSLMSDDRGGLDTMDE